MADIDPPDDDNQETDHFVGEVGEDGEGGSLSTEGPGSDDSAIEENTQQVWKLEDTVKGDELVDDALGWVVFNLQEN